jgi:hypothetical protein
VGEKAAEFPPGESHMEALLDLIATQNLKLQFGFCAFGRILDMLYQKGEGLSIL